MSRSSINESVNWSVHSTVSWSSRENILLLNPRLPELLRTQLEAGWQLQVQGKFSGQVGIATSGSSGSGPKLILLSKEALLTSAAAVNQHLKANAKDIWMKTLPDFHVGGLGILARASLNGAGIFESQLERWDPSLFYDELTQSGATLLSLVPTQLFDLIRLGLVSPKKLRAVVIGGGKLQEDLRQDALRLGWQVLPSYGMTECCSQVATALAPSEPELTLLSHVEVRISDDGRIEIKSPALLTGQLNFSSDDAQFLDPKADGWFRTEDRGRLLPGGRLEVAGRLQDFVKVGGEGVDLTRLETLFEAVKKTSSEDSVLLAAADARLGAVIVMLTTENSDEAKSLEERFNKQVLPFERIRAVYQVPSIPRSAIGKLLRVEALSLVGLKPFANV